MKKYLIKISTLALAALMGVCVLAGCGSVADNGGTPETETSEKAENNKTDAQSEKNESKADNKADADAKAE